LFGYANVQVDRHVERRIDDTEAAVVRRIFDLCASGVGFTRAAKLLNADGAACPRPQCGRPAGWAPSTVRDVLHRDLYRGVLMWNRTKKRDVSGDVAPRPRLASDWLRCVREDLRIVTDEQWEAAHTRLDQRRTTMTTGIGRRAIVRRDYESQYLLTGHARCATCGGAIIVVSRSHGRSRAYFYGCLRHWKRGATMCANDLVLPIARVDDAVVKAIGGDVLRPAVVSAVIEGLLAAIVPANVEERVDELRHQLRVLETKIHNLTAAVEQGGATLQSILALLAERQQERDPLVVELSSVETLQRIQVDRVAIERQVQAAVANWRELLSGSVADARQMLREVLEAPLRFEREGQTFRFSGPVATGKLIAGVVVGQELGASPKGVPGSRANPYRVFGAVLLRAA
jgi:hypothetical protein